VRCSRDLLSAEIHLLLNTLFLQPGLFVAGRFKGSILKPVAYLMGLCSFAFMWLGMRHQFKPLRIISLVLFSITLVKLFLFDIRNIPVAGR